MNFFYVHVTVHRNKFLYTSDKTNQMHQFHARVNLGNWCILLILL